MIVVATDVVGVATLVLAGVALALVLVLLGAMRGAVARLEAERRPLLIDGPEGVLAHVAEAKAQVTMAMRNAGGAVALIGDAGIAGAGLGPVEQSMVKHSHVPSGESTQIDLIAMCDGDMPPAWQVTVPYGYDAGPYVWVARLHIGQRAEGRWRVERVEQERAAAPARRPAIRSALRSPRPRREEEVVDLWGRPLSERRRPH